MINDFKIGEHIFFPNLKNAIRYNAIILNKVYIKKKDTIMK